MKLKSRRTKVATRVPSRQVNKRNVAQFIRDEVAGIQKRNPTKKHPHKGLLGNIGATIGNAIEPGAGGIVGLKAGEILGNLFGWGDYQATAPVTYGVNSNSLLGFQTPMAAQIPMMHTEDGVTRIRKREYIQDVLTTSTFSTLSFALNPSDVITFPWLSQIAENYEQFKFLGLAFGFRSTTANALGGAGTPGMGSVSLLTQYDVLDLPVINKTQANNALFATSCKPSESMLHPVECDPEQTPSQPLYTGVNEAFVTRDTRLNYLGFTTIATAGASATYTAGELWVSYDVMLYKPMVARGQLPPEPISVQEQYRNGRPARMEEQKQRNDEENDQSPPSEDFERITLRAPPCTPRRM
jgi:hypothetical protein